MENNSIRDVIFSRRSTRNFDKNYQMGREVQTKIIEAGLRAPSPKNRQPWFFTIVDNPKKREEIAGIMEEKLQELKQRRMAAGEMCSDLDMAVQTARIIPKASMIVFVGYDCNDANGHGEKMDWELQARGFEAADLQSIGAAVQNMLLQATELGIASLWICDVLYAHDALKEYLDLKYPFVAAVAFGKAMHSQGIREGIEKKAEWMDD